MLIFKSLSIVLRKFDLREYRKVSSYMRCISRARAYIEPDLKKRYAGLVNIGIDETSYRKGHSYVTVVVNHDTNTVVWCAPGHSTEVLSRFFEELTQEQRLNIKCVSGDGAKWIDACIEKYIPGK